MYRVKEVNGKFIPQVGSWLFGYRCIDAVDSYLWYDEETAIRWCKWDTLQQALDRIEKYRNTPNIKYHKVK